MKNIEEIKRELATLKEILHRDYGISRIEVFGSYVRGEQRPESDLDVLVDFDREVSLLDVIGLEQFLTDNVGIKTDVVLRRSVRNELKEIIFGEAVPV